MTLSIKGDISNYASSQRGFKHDFKMADLVLCLSNWKNVLFDNYTNTKLILHTALFSPIPDKDGDFAHYNYLSS